MQFTAYVINLIGDIIVEIWSNEEVNNVKGALENRILLFLGLVLVIFPTACIENPETSFYIENPETSLLPGPALQWSKIYGEVKDAYGTSAAQQTFDGGYIVCGHTWSQQLGSSNTLLIKTDTDGNELWIKTLEGREAWWVQQVTDGGYVLCGQTSSLGAGGSDVWLMKADAEGNTTWEKTFGGNRDDVGHFVQQTTDGGYIISGNTRSFGDGGVDIWLIKVDADANKQWDKTFGSDKDKDSEGGEVHQTTDGGYVLCGNIYITENPRIYWPRLIKTDDQGNMLWDRKFGEGNQGCLWVRQTLDCGYIMCGHIDMRGIDVRLLLVRTDTDGNKLWEKAFGCEWGSYGARSVQQCADGGFIMCGTKRRPLISGGSDHDIWLIKTDANGIGLWESKFGIGKSGSGQSVQQTVDGGYIVCGCGHTSGGTGSYIQLLKLAPEQ